MNILIKVPVCLKITPLYEARSKLFNINGNIYNKKLLRDLGKLYDWNKSQNKSQK